MYAGVGRITGAPGAEKNWIAAVRPATTSASGRTRSGSTSQPYVDRANPQKASDIPTRSDSVR